MTTDGELSDEVIAQIKAHRTVSAIKLAREQLDVDQKTATDLVEACEKALSPPAIGDGSEDSGSSIGRIVLLIAGVSLIFGIYTLIT